MQISDETIEKIKTALAKRGWFSNDGHSSEFIKDLLQTGEVVLRSDLVESLRANFRSDARISKLSASIVHEEYYRGVNDAVIDTLEDVLKFNVKELEEFKSRAFE